MRSRIDSEAMLRSVEKTDADALFRVVDGHRSHLGAWLPWVNQTRSADDTLVVVETSIENEKNGTGLAMIIERQGEICGSGRSRFHRREESIRRHRV